MSQVKTSLLTIFLQQKQNLTVYLFLTLLKKINIYKALDTATHSQCFYELLLGKVPAILWSPTAKITTRAMLEDESTKKRKKN